MIIAQIIFLVEEFESMAWLGHTVKRGMSNIYSFAPVLLAFVFLFSDLMTENFGPYFWQFRHRKLSFFSIVSWVLGSPANLMMEGVDIFHDDQSEELGWFLLLLTFIGII